MKQLVYICILFVLTTMGCEKNEDVYKTLADRTIFIPTVFTPNGDQHNDVFLPGGYGLTKVDGYQMNIFDFGGNKLFTSIEVFNGWNGLNDDGHPYPNGLYLYDIWFHFNDGEEVTAKGTIEISEKGW